jgi:hypothetical protein
MILSISRAGIGVGLFDLAADETGDLAGVLHQVPGFVGHFHLDQHVAREETTLGDRLGRS